MSSIKKGISPTVNTPENLEHKRINWLTTNPNNDPIIKRKIIEKNSRYWEITTPQNEVIIIKNLSDFCRKNNLSQPNMNTNKVKGWNCRKLPNQEITKQEQ